MNFSKLLIFGTLLSLLFPAASAFAKGEFSLEYPDGEIAIFENVRIFHTSDSIYFQDEEGTNTIVVNKSQCGKEGQLIFCDKAKVSVENHGVSEEIVFQQLVLFINNTSSKQTIEGSRLILKPQTVLVEGVTQKGTFVTGYGKIDSTEKPVEIE
jgi:RNase P/RNase MRP subunit p29